MVCHSGSAACLARAQRGWALRGPGGTDDTRDVAWVLEFFSGNVPRSSSTSVPGGDAGEPDADAVSRPTAGFGRVTDHSQTGDPATGGQDGRDRLPDSIAPTLAGRSVPFEDADGAGVGFEWESGHGFGPRNELRTGLGTVAVFWWHRVLRSAWPRSGRLRNHPDRNPPRLVVIASWQTGCQLRRSAPRPCQRSPEWRSPLRDFRCAEPGACADSALTGRVFRIRTRHEGLSSEGGGGVNFAELNERVRVVDRDSANSWPASRSRPGKKGPDTRKRTRPESRSRRKLPHS